MSTGSVVAWATALSTRVFERKTADTQKANLQEIKNKQVLNNIPRDPTALDTAQMQKDKLQSQFQGFDPKSVTPDQLTKYSNILKEHGLISTSTAGLLATAGTKNKAGEKFNALDYFATQISTLQSGSSSDQFSNHMIPEYKRAINVLLNLQQFASSGASMSVDTKV
ncbi:hypothetical protein [Pseudomonas sp. FEN]|uniref:hypothetical protein n=1 Tax=Pseudomonas sp. FEN TaxID=2767468 RepID=UPI00174B8F2B|nr:hypothetical protein [Pseudomonas sp. FEN]